MSLDDFCSKHKGNFKRKKYGDSEFEVCRIPIIGESPYQKRHEIYNIFRGVEDLAKEEFNISGEGLGTHLILSKATELSSVRGSVVVESPNIVTAVEVEFDTKERVYHVTPITERGRGCSLFFSKQRVGGYCDKHGTELDVESWVV